MSELATDVKPEEKPIAQKQKTIGEFLVDQKKQIEAALPKHLNADRMLRIVMTEIRKTPKLKQCTLPSLIGSVIQCAQLGLEPGSALGHAWLIPYDINRKVGNTWEKTTECQFTLGYRGMIDLARRSGQVISLSAHVVYSNDQFDFEYGLRETLRHVPTQNADRGSLIAVYAIAHLVGGGHQIRVMYKNEIDLARARSKTPDKGPWVTDYDEMAMKTVIRRLFKYLPVSIEIQKAVMLDEAGDRGEQFNGNVIEGEVDIRSFDDEFENPNSKADDLDKKLS